jgi:hypothetical protein
METCLLCGMAEDGDGRLLLRSRGFVGLNKLDDLSVCSDCVDRLHDLLRSRRAREADRPAP